MMRTFLLPLFFLSALFLLPAQTIPVYPGDATNNGEVNNIDFLYLGLAYNFIGPPRDSGLTVFIPQQATPWAYQFANGANFAHADCNGDGIVSYYYDAFPLYVNYGERHDPVSADVFTPGVSGIDPSLRFDESALPPSIHPGQMLSLPIVLGDVQVPVEDLYGLAFSIFVDPVFVDAGQVQLDFNQTSWANPDNDRVFMHKKVSDERVDVAWVRTDHNQRDGYGEIGRADIIIIIIDVIDLQQFTIRIDSVKMIDKFGNETTVAGDTAVIDVLPESLPTGTQGELKDYFQVRPNPASDQLQLRHSAPIEQITLFDALGIPVYHESPGQSEVDVHLPSLPSGIYLLQARSQQGTFLQKITIRQ